MQEIKTEKIFSKIFDKCSWGEHLLVYDIRKVKGL